MPLELQSHWHLYITIDNPDHKLRQMTTDKISEFISQADRTMRSVVKIMLAPHRSDIPRIETTANNTAIIMGNGPSLATAINENFSQLTSYPTFAVNFMGNTPEYTVIKPRYYVLIDPAFFKNAANYRNVQDLIRRFEHDTDWPMTLFVPYWGRKSMPRFNNPCIDVRYLSTNGLEGFGWFERWAFGQRLGTPRPRNVLIPSIMIAIAAGYRNIYLAGADHTWARTLSVNENNEVVSIQPHFYKDNEEYEQRARQVFVGRKLHEVYEAYAVAFKSYYSILRYASGLGVNIYNATPGSFIDAFPRRPLSEL